LLAIKVKQPSFFPLSYILRPPHLETVTAENNGAVSHFTFLMLLWPASQSRRTTLAPSALFPLCQLLATDRAALSEAKSCNDLEPNHGRSRHINPTRSISTWKIKALACKWIIRKWKAMQL